MWFSSVSETDLLVTRVKKIFISKKVTLRTSANATIMFFFILISYYCLLTVTDVTKTCKHFFKRYHYYFYSTVSTTLNLFEDSDKQISFLVPQSSFATNLSKNVKRFSRELYPQRYTSYFLNPRKPNPTDKTVVILSVENFPC